MQRGPGPLQPPVGQEPRAAAVDLLALWFSSAPALVLTAGAGGVAHHHEAVLALVGHHGLVGHGGEHGFAVHRTVWYWTLRRNGIALRTRGIIFININTGTSDIF